jgi:hypothetical protein
MRHPTKDCVTLQYIYRAENPVIRAGGPRHPDHLFRANPEKLSILREFFYMRLPWASLTTMLTQHIRAMAS